MKTGRRLRHRRRIALAAGLAVVAGGGGIVPAAFGATGTHHRAPVAASDTRTTTPIKHVVVIFDENISFDHYFGTYPHAANTDGTPFHAAPGTPHVNGLTPALLTRNANAYNPKRLTPSEALTCDQNHGYTAEQQAFDAGKMDKFVQYTENDTCTGQPVLFGEPGLVMDYFDGNTVTAMWNYAQHYAMDDDSFDAVFGPSSLGAIDLASGNTYGASAVDPMTGKPVTAAGVIGSPNAQGVGTLYNDADPAYDDCSDSNHTNDDPVIRMTGRNVGDLLDARNVTWGWFQGGFASTGTAKGYAQCDASHANIGGVTENDYVPHHDPFQYYAATANPHHLPPSSEAAIGHTDQANHNYDVSDFMTAAHDGNLPSVSFLKPPAYENGHAGTSDPLDEQRWLAGTIDAIQQSPQWKSTAIIVNYDDSDGWYDQQASPILNGSHDAAHDKDPACASKPALDGQQDRCGAGARLPLLVISPYSRVNDVDHRLTDQASALRFIEDNWHLGRIGNGSYDASAGSLLGMFDFDRGPHAAPLLLNPTTGAVETAAKRG